jgi:molybdopterin synthase sulfur carrier subunit
MLNVRFFSLLREALNTDMLELEWSSSCCTVEALKQELIKQNGSFWEEQLMHPNVIHAVNQRVVTTEEPLHDGDEIAFFPPMTGG